MDNEPGGQKPALYKLFCAQGSVQSDGSEGPGAIIHGLVAGGAHERGEFGRSEESRNRFWQIGIGGSIARNKPANSRQDFTKIPTIEIAQQAVWRLGEFKDGDGAAGLEDSLNFPQAGFVVGEVAKAEGAGHQVERSAGERKPESIGFEKRHWRCSTLVRRWRQGRAFLFCADEHGMGEIRADDAGLSGSRESESEIAGSAAEIEDERIGPVENGLQTPGGAGTPEAIELQRQEMVEQIVARGDLRKHFADFVRSVRLANGAFGPGSIGRCGSLSHGALAKACY